MIEAAANEITYTLVGLLLFGGVLWVLSRSPLLQALAAMVLTLAWGVVSVGSVLLVVLAIYLPKGQVGAALLTILVGAVLYVPFFAFGPGMLKQAGARLAKRPPIWE